MAPLCFAYYCSGHGYGHATRVSAFTRHLRGLESQPTIYIISSAPRHIFEDTINLGTIYRYAEIDPVIIQPVAYRVDRRKSIDVLRSFLLMKDTLVQQEKRWLLSIGADCVLTDAAFLGCLAAHAASLPSILITNFTFDSVYSYLATSYTDRVCAGAQYGDLPMCDKVPDEPISNEDIQPLVQQVYDGYRCADVLVRLPGYIPIPSFFASFALPAPWWTDQEANTLLPEVVHHLTQPIAESELCGHIIPFPHSTTPSKCLPRSVIQAPLVVRGITTTPESVYTPTGRSRFLLSLGIPAHLHDPDKTKILIVSFGGQVFRKPSSSRGSSSGHSTPGHTTPACNSTDFQDHSNSSSSLGDTYPNPIQAPHTTGSLDSRVFPSCCGSAKLASPSHLYVSGPPPAAKPDALSAEGEHPCVITIIDAKHTTEREGSYFDAMITSSLEPPLEPEPQLLPSSSWIAVVCGVLKEQWAEGEAEDGLPDNFFVAPKCVYMPDLMAVADVLLGKLGYGTVSESVDSCTPFVYVSRPLFVEEHGLKLFLSQQGVGVELSRAAYEAGHWAPAVEDAWLLGRHAKAKKRETGRLGIGMDLRDKEGRALATRVINWVTAWHSGLM
ncbi:hypothetical protein BU15DRAFT_42840 [Melanogaster broomeanus]|nr:hypothetical protein BU15DRAFT_42840 [Melanogaster broomeanus]